MAELAHAYVSLRVSTGGMQGDVRKALTGIEGDAQKTGQSMGSKISSGIGSVLKKTAVGVGVAGGAALAAGLTKGIGRLNSIEQAQSKLTGLGNSASDVGGIMENALAAVKGTAYGLEDAATIAASAVAAGVKPGQDLERTLKLTGDAAAIAGVGLSEMGSIVNKVATSDMMQMDVANQLMDAGIPILQMVGQEMGVTAEEARKLASEGKVSFEIFQNALESGVGGAALEMGNTTQGAFQNMMAAAGRLGATLAGPFFTQAGGAFRGVTDLLDDLNAKVGPVMDRFGSWLEGTAVPALSAFGASAADAFKQFAQSEFARVALSDLKGVFSSLASTAGEVWPSLVKIGDALADASAALGVSAWSAFVASLQVVSGVLSALTGPLEVVADVMQAQPGLVTAAVAAWLAFKTVPSIIGPVGAAITGLQSKVKAATGVFSGFGEQMKLQATLAQMSGESVGTMGSAVAVAQTRVSGAMSKIKTSVKGVVDAFGGLSGIALTGAVTMLAMNASSAQSAKAANDALAEAAAKGAEAQRELSSALGETNNALDGQALSAAMSMVNSSMAETIELGQRGHTSIENLGHLIDNLTGNMFGLNSAWEADYDRVTANVENYDALQSAMSASNLSMEGVQRAVAEGGPVFDQLIRNLNDGSEGGQRMAGVLQDAREQIAGMQGMVERVGPGFYTLRDALDVLGDSASTADQKLNSMRSALEQMGIIQSSAEQQVANVAAQVERLGEAVAGTTFGADEFGRAFQNADGSLNLLNTNTHALNDALTGTRDELLGVAASGGDALGLFEQMQPEIESLRGQVEAAGYDFDGYLETIGLTPEAIATAVSLVGRESVEADILAITNKLRESEAGAKVPVEIRGGPEAVAQIEAVGIKVHEFDQETGEATVSVRNQEALDRIWQTHGSLDVLDNKSSISDILAVNGDAEGKIWQTHGGLTTLDATNPLSTIMAENGQAQGAIGATQGGLDQLGATHPESKIRADNSQAGSAISQAKGWLDSIPLVKTTRVVFSAVYQGFRNLTGGGEQHGGAWDGTRSLRRFATGGHSGYRLPTTGPGTEITDGFIAFNRDNVPAARLDAGEWIINRRSSDKYNKELAAINAGTFPKLPGYADGGRADAKELLEFVHGRGGHGQSRSLEGAPYVWGGVNWGDCSGAMSAIARFAVGLAPFAGRFATGNMRSALLDLGFKLGRGSDGDLRFGWKNGGPGGGHTSGTLPDGTNVEMGGGRGNGQIGGNAAPASHGQYTDHAYLPIHTWQFAGVEGLDGLMPPGANTTWSGMAGTTGTTGTSSPGLYQSPGNSGQVSKDQPRTWSDMAAGAVSALVGGQVEDMLGVFGVPNQLPPIIQAWQMLNEKPGGGPSDWDLSTAAAEIKRLDAAIKIREQATSEAARALDAMNDNGVGNALPSAVVGAEAELDKQLLALESDRLAYERAQDRLEELLGARAAAVAEKDLTSASSASDLASALAPDVSMPDELQRELKVTYDPAGGAEQWRPMVIAALKRNGFAATQREQDLMIAQINTESGGDPSIIQQVQDVNSGGNEAVGLLQVIPGTFAAHRDPELPDDRTDPWANMNAALRYYKSRYGMDLGVMWGKGHGYNLGGWIHGSGTKDSVPLVGAPGEFIVNRKAAAENRAELEAMNAGRSVPSRGGSVTYNIHTFDLDDAMRELSRREAQHAQTYLGAR